MWCSLRIIILTILLSMVGGSCAFGEVLVAQNGTTWTKIVRVHQGIVGVSFKEAWDDMAVRHDRPSYDKYHTASKASKVRRKADLVALGETFHLGGIDTRRVEVESKPIVSDVQLVAVTPAEEESGEYEQLVGEMSEKEPTLGEDIGAVAETPSAEGESSTELELAQKQLAFLRAQNRALTELIGNVGDANIKWQERFRERQERELQEHPRYGGVRDTEDIGQLRDDS